MRYMYMAQKQSTKATPAPAPTPAPTSAPAPAPTTPRVPPPVLGINVNHCKNPNCINFGVPVPEVAQKGPGAINIYTVVAVGAKAPAAKCSSCGEIFTLKSNRGVFEETYRILEQTHNLASCPDTMCPNHRVPLQAEGAYRAIGATKLGSKRYLCKAGGCGKTFSVKPKGINPIAKQTQSDKNRLILAMLVGKMPLRRICEAAEVSPPVLYERIDFFHKQASAFLAERERQFSSMEVERLYIGVDRQDHVINWSRRDDKRNVTLSSIAAADNRTGYVFGMHPNFDPDADSFEVEKRHLALGDDQVGHCHRTFARLWLQDDYGASLLNSKKYSGQGTLASSISATYANASLKDDVESPEHFTADDRLPEKGMLVHSEYTMYGFFLAMRQMFKNVGKVRFFLDQDSGMRGACLSAFADKIKKHACDVFYVRIAKDLTVDEKRKAIGIAKGLFDQEAADNPDLKPHEVKLLMLKARIEEARNIGPWKDRWVFHPLPSLSEAEKALCHLTDFGQYDEDHLAWLYNKASLHAVDSFFNRIRRRSSMLERPISSSANRGRVWNAYSAYRPEQINKIQTIIRACHNFVWTPPDPKKGVKPETPAMRLGLAKAPLGLTDILYFK